MDENPDTPFGPMTIDPELVEGEDEESQVFSWAPAPRKAHEEEYFSGERIRMPSIIRDLGIHLNSRRRATQHVAIRGVATAYLDEDTSGTYDPKFDRATPEIIPPQKTKRSKLPENLDENGEPRPLRPKRQVGHAPSCVVVISFKEAKSLKYLRSLTPGPLESQHSNGHDKFSVLPVDSEYPTNSALKHRQKVRQPRRLGATSSRVDGLTISQLTVGHPQRRGCKSCFEIGDDDCTLIENSSSYPCVACEDAGVDCEFIIPPEFKKVCERCKHKRIRCSYRQNGGKGINACEACEKAEVPCYAGPLRPTSCSRRYDDARPESGGSHRGPPPAPVAPPQVYASCNECRSLGLRCSLQRNQIGPCSKCRADNNRCTFVLKTARTALPLSLNPTQKISASAKAAKSQSRTPSTPKRETRQKAMGNPYTPTKNSQTLLTEMAKIGRRQPRTYTKDKNLSAPYAKLVGRTSGINHIIITTSFCHPIKFNYVPDPLGKYPCTWCVGPFFGLWGHGEKTVEVIPWGGDIGNEELDGGHAMDGNENSKMCVECTFSRIKMITCEDHKVTRIRDGDRGLWNENTTRSFEALGRGDERGGQLARALKWCSVCVTLAEFRCCAGDDGCGSLLCGGCADLLGKIQGSRGKGQKIVVMDQLLKHWEKTRWMREGVDIRADSGFLSSEGELMVRMRAGMGITVGKNEEDAFEVKNVKERHVMGGDEKERRVGTGIIKTGSSFTGRRIGAMGVFGDDDIEEIPLGRWDGKDKSYFQGGHGGYETGSASRVKATMKSGSVLRSLEMA